jgi:arsenite-transporting ATPase
VGKTTAALATAFAAAEHGHRVFVLSTDAAHSLGDALGRTVGARATQVAERVVAQEVGVLDELDRGWTEIQSWLRTLLREDADAMVADELLVFPGLEELLCLRAIRAVEATGEFDVCVVDCAPTGSTLRLLRFPDALRVFMEQLFDIERRGVRVLRPVLGTFGAGRMLPSESFFDAFERLYRDVDDVRQILLDTDRTSARLVVNPARVVVAESRRSYAYLCLFGVMTDAVLVNRLLPDAASGGYFARWADRQAVELREIEESFPLPRFHAPLHAREPIGAEALTELGRELFGDTDPAALLIRQPPIRVRKRGGRSLLEIDLPGTSKEELEVVALGGELLVRARDATRRIALPASLAGRSLDSIRLTDGRLEISFGS